MINEKTTLQFSSNALRRYEQNVQDGTYFLYNIDSKELWTGNEAAFRLLNLINGKTRLKEIYKKSKALFKENGINVIRDSVDAILIELIDKKIIYIV